jgi:putative endonuclease
VSRAECDDSATLSAQLPRAQALALRQARGVTATRQRLGARGEEIAARSLAAAGWRIVARNARTRYGELDLVAIDAHALVFVEVKATREGGFAGPERPALAVGPQKQRRIRRLAVAYLAGRPPLPRFAEIRFDVIGISFAADGRVADYEHIESAF